MVMEHDLVNEVASIPQPILSFNTISLALALVAYFLSGVI